MPGAIRCRAGSREDRTVVTRSGRGKPRGAAWRRALAALTLALIAGPAPAERLVCRAEIARAQATLNACAGREIVRIAAVGDVLLHRWLQRKGFSHPDGFRSLWRRAEPFFAMADVTYANLEGPSAPGATRRGVVADPGPRYDGTVYTGYPRFNYHPSAVAALKASGVDIVSTANNHAMDRGSHGANLTIATLRRAGLAYTGTIPAGARRDFVAHTRTRLGRLAWIACSFSTNGIADPARQVLLCYRDRQELLGLVTREAARADVAGVIVTPHWGLEYHQTPDPSQRRLARDLAAAGATAIIGAHPHVVQSWEYIEGRGGRTVPVIYSNGNFVSSQGGLSRRTGTLSMLELCRAPGGGLAVARAGALPILMTGGDAGPELSVVPYRSTGTLGAAEALVRRRVGETTLFPRLVCRRQD